MKLVVFIAVVVLFSLPARASSLPSLLCEEGQVAKISHANFPDMNEYNSSRIFRIDNGKVYLSAEGQDEYFYADLKSSEIGMNRFVSSHITFQFEPDYKSGFDVVVSSTDTQIGRLSCRGLAE